MILPEMGMLAMRLWVLLLNGRGTRPGVKRGEGSELIDTVKLIQ